MYEAISRMDSHKDVNAGEKLYRNAGRDQIGLVGEIISDSRATSPGIRIPRDVAVQRGLVSLGQALATGGQQHTPGQPVTRPKEPKVSDRIGAARRVGELSTQIYEAKRRGDLDEAQDLMRELASAQVEYNRLKAAGRCCMDPPLLLARSDRGRLIPVDNWKLRRAVQTPRRTPPSYPETALSGDERAGL